ncbi:MAG: energy transducer TonB [Candidatus Margulisbacteria bacterium]|nr:energy transducer TonB [Candidatus Margulisiibacteriota bacterium]
MIRAKEVSITNAILFTALFLVLSTGYFLTRPQIAPAGKELVFLGETVTVNQAAKTISAVPAKQAIRTVSVPAPAPQIAAPLPIMPPVITFKVLPVYPAAALQKGLEGTALLSVYIGLNGQPEKVEVKTSSGVPEFDGSAVQAVEQWRFTPAAQGSAALASWYEIPVRFEVK